ncbi:hypothetical protein CVT25_014327 [Psilocybe cyanescens]|uniref:Retrotransposon gag domain-containing protein n=1 Tax=Psilocybe cyanescens TaxID=93625 RepID=A0A409XKY3_PSICY|nr:hypothetical protein CVT25_014327 [Psilocybe cyanescens]
MSHNPAFTNSFEILPEFSASTAEHQQQAGQAPYVDNPGPSGNPGPEDERSFLWKAIFGLGQNLDTFANRQSQEAMESHNAFQAIAQQLQQLSLNHAQPTPAVPSTGSSTIPRVREPRKFDGRAQSVDPFVREINNSLVLQHRAFTSDRDKSLYFGFYLEDGSPSAWYTSVEKYHPELLDNFEAFLNAFKKHFEDSDRYATALAKLRKLKQDGSAATYASRHGQGHYHNYYS